MHTADSGSEACQDPGRAHRLAAQLADMIPGAATIRVSLTDPVQRWPNPHAVVKNEAGKRIELARATATIAARWILRVWPEADWTQPHVFDLATATLIGSDIVATDEGR